MRAPAGLRGVEGGRARSVGTLASTCPSRALAGKRGSREPPRAGWQAWRGSCLRTRGLEAGRSRRAGTGVHMRGKAAVLPELSGQGSLVGRLDITRFLTFRLSPSRHPWPYLAQLCPRKRETGLGRWDRWGIFPKLLRLLINLLAKARREAPKAKFS